MNDPMADTRSPLVTIISLAPDAAFATAHDLRRATVSVLGLGARMSLAVAGTVLESPPLRAPVALLEAQVGALSARGAELRQNDPRQTTSLVTRASSP